MCRCLLALGGVLWPAAGSRAAEAAEPAPAESFPAATLRGYGRVEGALRKTGDGGAVLEIRCENEARARLLQAKYLSDLHLLPGVRDLAPEERDGIAPAVVAAPQGWLTALVADRRVFLASAPGEAGLKRVLETLPAAAITADSGTPHAEVPMWLDRWDRYGFRFYYRSWDTPPKVREQDYDFLHEFDYAAEHGRSGFVFWDQMFQLDRAEGVMDDGWFDWAQAAARERHLPVGINLSVEQSTDPVWLLNRYRDQTMQYMPGYVGDFYSVGRKGLGERGSLSWSATTAEDAALATLQASVRRFAAEPNVVSWLEPHGELVHGSHDELLEYGPVADRSYREYLKKRYDTPARVSQRWFGQGDALRSWDDVHVPELVSFCGFGPEALDLTGTWRYSPPPAPAPAAQPAVPPKAPALPAWAEAGFDDSAWPEMVAPGDDHAIMLSGQRAVWRRTFEVDPAWLTAHRRVWLYVWDLNGSGGQLVEAYLNGRKIASEEVRGARRHWMVCEATAALTAGRNCLALSLPDGYIGYRVYISAEEPAVYPYLGPGKNAQWADFQDWRGWSRGDMVRRGMEMIRQVDPDRPITLMAPDAFGDEIKPLAERFGGEFHNTGYMMGFYSELLPALMRGSGLPFSLEPGGPAGNIPDLRHYFGLAFSEGVQGYDYFIHIGNILWQDDLRHEYEAMRPALDLIGKYHSPRAEVAVFFSQRSTRLRGPPWPIDGQTTRGDGYWDWSIMPNLIGRYPIDGVGESDFTNGNAARYRVIIDANTAIMDEAQVQAIERYVRAGGTFVTLGQTGRHTPEIADAWPIARLTGYKVLSDDASGLYGGSLRTRGLKSGADETWFPGSWQGVLANGLRLARVAPDAEDLLWWDDGTVAIGRRRLGAGQIIEVGAKFSGSYKNTRYDQAKDYNESEKNYTRVYGRILEICGLTPTPAHLSRDGTPAGWIMLRHYISNNGLYDVWTVWNQNREKPLETDLVLTTPELSPAGFDVVAGKTVPIEPLPEGGGQIAGIRLGPLETRVFLTPRIQIGDTAGEWFALQRSWWRETGKPAGPPLSAPPHRWSEDLTDGWVMRPLADKADPAALKLLTRIDPAAPVRPLGVVVTPPGATPPHTLWLKRFTIPREWHEGATELWLQSANNTTFINAARVFLDGKIIQSWSAQGFQPWRSPLLAAGTTHVLAIETVGGRGLTGARGSCWLWHEPPAESSVDLAGDWTLPKTPAHPAVTVKLPGTFTGAPQRTIELPASAAGQQAVLEIAGPVYGVFVNGHWVARFHHRIGTDLTLDITPWLHFGEKNELELRGWDAQVKVDSVQLKFFRSGYFP